MKISKNNKRIKQKTLNMTIIAIVALGFLAVSYFSFNNPIRSTSQSTNLDKPTDEQKSAGNEIKQGAINNNSDDGSKNTLEAKSQAQQVSVTITAINQTDQALQIRTLINSQNIGSCSIKLEGQIPNTIEKTSDTQTLPNASTCKGFDIPVAELPPGVYKLTVEFVSDGTSGTATESVTIQ